MTAESSPNGEKPFLGYKIYYSGSIRGVVNSEPEFAWKLVQNLISKGADVLSEHVAARNFDEMDDTFFRKSGVDRRSLTEPWFAAREVDFEWVDEATHMIAVVNGPSHGVGMELQRAIDKPRMGMNLTPVLCLVHESLFENLTWMIRGVSETEHSGFELRTYKSLEDAEKITVDFLTKHSLVNRIPPAIFGWK